MKWVLRKLCELWKCYSWNSWKKTRPFRENISSSDLFKVLLDDDSAIRFKEGQLWKLKSFWDFKLFLLVLVKLWIVRVLLLLALSSLKSLDHIIWTQTMESLGHIILTQTMESLDHIIWTHTMESLDHIIWTQTMES